ncbi:hypothetical protein L1887_56892 [Cichorium endivia]|nr:hypothetical protein L1887_56892 [Cichorium endivia]
MKEGGWEMLRWGREGSKQGGRAGSSRGREHGAREACGQATFARWLPARLVARKARREMRGCCCCRNETRRDEMEGEGGRRRESGLATSSTEIASEGWSRVSEVERGRERDEELSRKSSIQTAVGCAHAFHSLPSPCRRAVKISAHPNFQRELILGARRDCRSSPFGTTSQAQCEARRGKARRGKARPSGALSSLGSEMWPTWQRCMAKKQSSEADGSVALPRLVPASECQSPSRLPSAPT